eukprot:768397-Hanusia_phi.AAC.14
MIGGTMQDLWVREHGGHNETVIGRGSFTKRWVRNERDEQSAGDRGDGTDTSRRGGRGSMT